MIDSTRDNHGRLHPLGVYLHAKAAFRKLCNAAGGYEAAAGHTRGTTATLHRHGDPVRDDLFPAIDMVLDLEAATGNPCVTALMAKVAGYRLEPIDRAPVSPATAVAAPANQVLTVMKEVGEYAQAVANMEADGKRSLNEINAVIREAEEAREAIESSLDTLFRLKAEKLAELGQGS